LLGNEALRVFNAFAELLLCDPNGSSTGCLFGEWTPNPQQNYRTRRLTSSQPHVL
jgi:hypothetical protein